MSNNCLIGCCRYLIAAHLTLSGNIAFRAYNSSEYRHIPNPAQSVRWIYTKLVLNWNKTEFIFSFCSHILNFSKKFSLKMTIFVQNSNIDKNSFLWHPSQLIPAVLILTLTFHMNPYSQKLYSFRNDTRSVLYLSVFRHFSIAHIKWTALNWKEDLYIILYSLAFESTWHISWLFDLHWNLKWSFVHFKIACLHKSLKFDHQMKARGKIFFK